MNAEQPSEEEFMCNYCRVPHFLSEGYELPCGHHYCREFLQPYIASELKKNTSVIPCPLENCTQRVDQRCVRAVCSQADAAKFVSLQGKFAMAKRVGDEEMIFVCPTPECGAEYIVSRNVHGCRCRRCGIKYCAECRKQFHPNSECPMNSVYMKVDKTVYAPCPVCRLAMHRKTGCKFVACESEFCQGQTFFCMMCQKRVKYMDQVHPGCDGFDFLEFRDK